MRSNKGSKRAVNRHQTQSKATAGRLERGFEKQDRQAAKKEIDTAQATSRSASSRAVASPTSTPVHSVLLENTTDVA